MKMNSRKFYRKSKWRSNFTLKDSRRLWLIGEIVKKVSVSVCVSLISWRLQTSFGLGLKHKTCFFLFLVKEPTTSGVVPKQSNDKSKSSLLSTTTTDVPKRDIKEINEGSESPSISNSASVIKLAQMFAQQTIENPQVQPRPTLSLSKATNLGRYNYYSCSNQ